MDFQMLSAARYSLRKFSPAPVEAEKLALILESGRNAPTAHNNQPQRILVLNTAESMEKLRTCTKCHFGAPTAMLICHNPEESWKRPYDGALSAPVDAAIVATHMMLAAHDIGVGCCWVMHFDSMKMRETFHIPENTTPTALLVMGYPAEDAKPLPLHTQFRPMEEMVFYGDFGG